jgi:sugar lactone lactonase YvrE
VASAIVTASPAVAPSGSPPPPVAKLLWTATAPGDPFIPNTMTHDPAGRIWVAQPDHDRFAIFKPDGTFVEYWGVPGSGDGQLNLRRPLNGDGYGAVAFAANGSFYVLDVGNRRVQVFDAHRRFVRAWGGFGLGPGQFNDPVGIVVGRDGRIHVLDDVRGVIETYDSTGKVLGSFKAFVSASDGFNAANALATDAAGNLYVSDILPSQVERFDPAGNLTMTYGSPGTGPGQFSEQPGGMVVDSRGRLFVNQGPGRDPAAPGVLVFDPDGTYVDGFGSVGPGDIQLRWPTGMLLEGKDTIVVGDAASNADSSLTSALKAFRLLPPLKP